MKHWLYLIADFSYGEEKIEEALRAGIDYLQLREKNISSAEYLKRARKLREMTGKYNTKFIVNDRADIAVLSEADGVHVGQSDIPVRDARSIMGKGRIVGATAKTPEQALEAQQAGADYLGSGAWFATATKKDAVPIKEETYREILKTISIPNVAVGGITAENCGKPLSCGANGLAISAGILQAADVTAEVRKLREICRQFSKEENKVKTVLTIAGSDCSGGAGIQADMKTITVHGLYGETVITALTAQNTMGVAEVLPVPPEFLEEQLKCVFEDIVPEAVKVGMIPGVEQMEVLVSCFRKYRPKNIVMDTVMISTSGRNLMEPEAVKYYQERLLPLADIYTPNIPEAELLSGRRIRNREERLEAAEQLAAQYPGAVLIKGGHEKAQAEDLLLTDRKTVWFPQKHIENCNTHGTGCTLSSAIACGLAEGKSMEESVGLAKEYITGAIADGLNLGKGNGPLNHMYRLGKC